MPVSDLGFDPHLAPQVALAPALCLDHMVVGEVMDVGAARVVRETSQG